MILVECIFARDKTHRLAWVNAQLLAFLFDKRHLINSHSQLGIVRDIGEVGEHTHVSISPLLESLSTASDNMCKAIQFTLSRVRYIDENNIKNIVQLLDDIDETVQAHAAYILGKITSSPELVTTPLKEKLERCGDNPQLVSCISYALNHLEKRKSILNKDNYSD